jgi:hypothetical protein
MRDNGTYVLLKLYLEENIMKRMGAVFAVVALATAFAVVGCATGGGGRADPDARFTVDLSTLPAIRNVEPFTKQWDQFMVDISGLPVDVSEFRRITVRLRALDANGNNITSWGANGVTRLIVDTTGYTHGSQDDRFKNVGGNVAFVEVNTGFEGLGAISSDQGVLMGIRQRPGGLLFENNSADVSFLEITEITFHNSTAKVPEIRPIGDLGAFDLMLGDNFQWGAGYQGMVRDFNLLGGERVRTGETYTLQITYTADRDLEDYLRFGFVDTTGNGWRTLSYRQPTNVEMPDVMLPASSAGEEVTATLTINILATAGGVSSAANTFVVETGGEGRRGVPNSGVRGAVTISFSEFILTKAE